MSNTNLNDLMSVKDVCRLIDAVKYCKEQAESSCIQVWANASIEEHPKVADDLLNKLVILNSIYRYPEADHDNEVLNV